MKWLFDQFFDDIEVVGFLCKTPRWSKSMLSINNAKFMANMIRSTFLAKLYCIVYTYMYIEYSNAQYTINDYT